MKTLRDLIPSVTQVARHLDVSQTTVYNWIKRNKMPYKHVGKLAEVLDIPIPTLFEYAEKVTDIPQIAKKTEDDFEAINNAYLGLPYHTTLSDHAMKLVLTNWGDRWPLLYETLKSLHAGEITASQAAAQLGCAISTIHGLRKRYGLAPGARKAKPKVVRTKKDRNWTLALDVIAGRTSVLRAIQSQNDTQKHPKISERTLHRYIKQAIQPLGLNDLAHWSRSFRSAFALEVDKKSPKVVQKWRDSAEKRGLILPKHPKYPKVVEDWRKAPLWRLVVALLLGEANLDEIAERRGGSSVVIKGLIDDFLRQSDLECLGLSVHHQAAAAEILLAKQSHFRKGQS